MECAAPIAALTGPVGEAGHASRSCQAAAEAEGNSWRSRGTVEVKATVGGKPSSNRVTDMSNTEGVDASKRMNWGEPLTRTRYIPLPLSRCQATRSVQSSQRSFFFLSLLVLSLDVTQSFAKSVLLKHAKNAFCRLGRRILLCRCLQMLV